MPKKKKQHYVPIFYLKRFSDPSSLNDKDPFLWVFDKKDGNVFPRSPKNIGFEKYFYSFESDGQWDNDDLIGNELKIHDIKKRYLLSKFICFLYTRTPKAREHLRIIAENVLKEKFVEMVNSEGGLEKFLKKHGKTWTPEEFIKSFNGMKFTPGRYTFLEGMIESTKLVIPHFANRNWVSLIPKSKNMFFITSDHPVLPFNSEIKDENTVPGFAQKETDIYFPISPKLCLLATYKFAETTIEIEDNKVSWINQMFLFWAHRYIFSCSRKFNQLLKSKQ